MRFEFANTHAYPGCRARQSEASEDPDTSECLVEFSDGVTVAGHWTASADGIVVRIPTYRTTRGTSIEAKAWLLQADGEAGRWRVRERM